MTKLQLMNMISGYKNGFVSFEAIETAVEEYSSASNGAKPIVSGSLPPKYEVRNASNGDECIMLKDFNVRIATFSKGTSVDAYEINRLLGGK